MNNCDSHFHIHYVGFLVMKIEPAVDRIPALFEVCLVHFIVFQRTIHVNLYYIARI